MEPVGDGLPLVLKVDAERVVVDVAPFPMPTGGTMIGSKRARVSVPVSVRHAAV